MTTENLPSKIGEYTILSKLGEGAMGIVYKASVGDLVVAIKVISPEISGDQEFIRRFLREMQVVSTLDHPNIVKAVDFGVDITENIYFVALEFVDGESLQDLLEREKKLSLEQSLRITQKIAQGLDYAYQNGIVHRDIKPDNILLSQGGTIVKLADFGLVKSQSQSSITQTGTILGTPFYLAPEQAFAEKEIDIRADIYSLGITLYHLICGRPPFPFKNPMKVITAHCYSPLPPMSDFVSGLPSEIVKLIDKMTDKERENRFNTPTEVSQFIEEFLRKGNVPILSAPQTVQEEEEYEDAPTRIFQGEVPKPPQQKPTSSISPKKITQKMSHSHFSSPQNKPVPTEDNRYLYIAIVITLIFLILLGVVGWILFKNFL